jgi:hypothetical protein
MTWQILLDESDVEVNTLHVKGISLSLFVYIVIADFLVHVTPKISGSIRSL